MSEADLLHRFIFERFPVHGKKIYLESAWRAVILRQEYPPAIRAVLGHAFAATVLLASTLKFEGKMTLQLQGDGPLSMLVVQCNDALEMRGLAKWEEGTAETAYDKLVGAGTLTVTIETRGDRYQGIVPLGGAYLAENIETYFRSSDQLPTRLWLASSDHAVGGFLLQKMPQEQEDHPHSAEAADTWPRVEALASTLREEELLSLSVRDLLHRLFHEDDIRLFKSRPVRFDCSCSRSGIEDVLRAMGADEVREAASRRGRVTVRCEFCSQSYNFDAIDTETIFTGSPMPGSDAVH